MLTIDSSLFVVLMVWSRAATAGFVIGVLGGVSLVLSLVIVTVPWARRRAAGRRREQDVEQVSSSPIYALHSASALLWTPALSTGYKPSTPTENPFEDKQPSNISRSTYLITQSPILDRSARSDEGSPYKNLAPAEPILTPVPRSSSLPSRRNLSIQSELTVNRGKRALPRSPLGPLIERRESSNSTLEIIIPSPKPAVDIRSPARPAIRVLVPSHLVQVPSSAPNSTSPSPRLTSAFQGSVLSSASPGIRRQPSPLASSATHGSASTSNRILTPSSTRNPSPLSLSSPASKPSSGVKRSESKYLVPGSSRLPFVDPPIRTVASSDNQEVTLPHSRRSSVLFSSLTIPTPPAYPPPSSPLPPTPSNPITSRTRLRLGVPLAGLPSSPRPKNSTPFRSESEDTHASMSTDVPMSSAETVRRLLQPDEEPSSTHAQVRRVSASLSPFRDPYVPAPNAIANSNSNINTNASTSDGRTDLKQPPFRRPGGPRRPGKRARRNVRSAATSSQRTPNLNRFSYDRRTPSPSPIYAADDDGRLSQPPPYTSRIYLNLDLSTVARSRSRRSLAPVLPSLDPLTPISLGSFVLDNHRDPMPEEGGWQDEVVQPSSRRTSTSVSMPSSPLSVYGPMPEEGGWEDEVVQPSSRRTSTSVSTPSSPLSVYGPMPEVSVEVERADDAAQLSRASTSVSILHSSPSSSDHDPLPEVRTEAERMDDEAQLSPTSTSVSIPPSSPLPLPLTPKSLAMSSFERVYQYWMGTDKKDRQPKPTNRDLDPDMRERGREIVANRRDVAALWLRPTSPLRPVKRSKPIVPLTVDL